MGIRNDANYVDGTIPPSGAAGSIAFTPQESDECINELFDKLS